MEFLLFSWLKDRYEKKEFETYTGKDTEPLKICKKITVFLELVSEWMAISVYSIHVLYLQ